MSGIRRLGLRGTAVTNAGMVYIEKLRKLENLDVMDTAVTEVMAIELLKRMNLRGIDSGSSEGFAR